MERIKFFVKENGTLLTILTSTIIVFTGIALIERPDSWWITFFVLMGISIIVLAFFNTRYIVKAIIAVLITLFTASYGFKLGSQLQLGTLDYGGSIWMITTIALFFGMLSISYLVTSVVSRWNLIIALLTTNFLAALFFSAATLNSTLGSIVAFLITMLTFFLIYKYAPKNRFKRDHMPDTEWEPYSPETIAEQFIQHGYGAVVNKKKKQTSITVWNDNYAWNLVPITMSNAFGLDAKKHRGTLRYNGKNITSWLHKLVMYSTLTKRTGNAPIMTILMDLKNTNGKEPKVIGIGIPDTKTKIPIGILPSKELMNNQKKLETKVFKEFEEYNTKLSEKQVYLLDTHLPEQNTGDEKID